jgi:hypothetical protein
MYVERSQNGDFVLNPSELAARFGLSDDDFRRNIRKGLIRSTVERGEAEDAGTCRLSVKFGNRVWRAVLDGEGRIATEEMAFLRTSP